MCHITPVKQGSAVLNGAIVLTLLAVLLHFRDSNCVLLIIIVAVCPCLILIWEQHVIVQFHSETQIGKLFFLSVETVTLLKVINAARAKVHQIETFGTVSTGLQRITYTATAKPKCFIIILISLMECKLLKS